MKRISKDEVELRSICNSGKVASDLLKSPHFPEDGVDIDLIQCRMRAFIGGIEPREPKELTANLYLRLAECVKGNSKERDRIECWIVSYLSKHESQESYNDYMMKSIGSRGLGLISRIHKLESFKDFAAFQLEYATSAACNFGEIAEYATSAECNFGEIAKSSVEQNRIRIFSILMSDGTEDSIRRNTEMYTLESNKLLNFLKHISTN